MTTSTSTPRTGDGFAHPALLYDSDAEFVDQTTRFLDAALAAGTPALAALPPRNLDLLRAGLHGVDGGVRWIDMAGAGRNPGRILPGILTAFADEHEGRPVAMVGEPIWAERSEGEYAAAVQHEALINLAFAGRDATILCPYDLRALPRSWIADAERTHPVLIQAGAARDSGDYGDPAAVAAEAVADLPEPPAGAVTAVVLDPGDLAEIRTLANTEARRFGLSAARAADLALVVDELAANAIRHGHGPGVVRIWRDDDERGRASVVAEVHDPGRITDPLAGRRPFAPGGGSGLGLLVVHQLADLVQLHSDADGTTVQAHFAVD